MKSEDDIMAFRIQIDGNWHERIEDLRSASMKPEVEWVDQSHSRNHHGRRHVVKPPPADLKQKPLNGHFFWIGQRHLDFGSDAKPPRTTRPIMCVVERRGPVAPVCPCTSQSPESYKFLFLHLKDWDRWFPQERDIFKDSWLYRNYETVRRDDFGKPLLPPVPIEELEKIRRWLLGEVAP